MMCHIPMFRTPKVAKFSILFPVMVSIGKAKSPAEPVTSIHSPGPTNGPAVWDRYFRVNMPAAGNAAHELHLVVVNLAERQILYGLPSRNAVKITFGPRENRSGRHQIEKDQVGPGDRFRPVFHHIDLGR